MMRRIIIACLTSALLVCASAKEANYQQVAVVKQAQPLAKETRELRVSTRVGDISIVPGNGEQMTVEADVRVDARRVDPATAGKNFADHVSLSEENGIITIADTHKDDKGGAWKVSFTVTMPRALAVTARTGVGNARVESAEGDVGIHTGVGDITLHAEKLGAVTAETGVGTAHLELGTVSGELVARAGTGHLRITSKQIDGKIQAKVGTGDVSVAVLEGGGAQDTLVQTGVGNVTLQLPEKASGEFELNAGVGSVNVTPEGLLQVRRNQTGGSASGQVGDGLHLHKVSTGVGSVRLQFGAK